MSFSFSDYLKMFNSVVYVLFKEFFFIVCWFDNVLQEKYSYQFIVLKNMLNRDKTGQMAT